MATKTVPQRLKTVENQVINLAAKIVDQDKTIADLLHPSRKSEPEVGRVVNAMTAVAAESPGPTRKSSMQTVQERVCFLQGHVIGMLERQVPNTELPDPSKTFHKTTVTKQEILCLRCGMTLDEIRRAQ